RIVKVAPYDSFPRLSLNLFQSVYGPVVRRCSRCEPRAMTGPAVSSRLERTPLHELHVECGARLVPFAGYEMPLQYRLGILKEHLHVRAAAGLFDVSHMGQLAVRPRSGRMENAALALERVMPVDVAALPVGRQRY